MLLLHQLYEFLVMLCQQSLNFYAKHQYKSAPACCDEGGESASTINTGRKFFDNIGCCIVGAIVPEKIEDRQTPIGLAAERFTIVASGLSISFAEVQQAGQIFVYANATNTANAISGQIELLRQYGTYIHMLIDPAKPCPPEALRSSR
jgi:hypothetical protein